MNLNEIREGIDPELYASACRDARNTAVGTHKGDTPSFSFYDVTEYINDLIWEAEIPDTAKIELTFGIYLDMPCYTFLSELVVQHYKGISPQASELFWQYCREILSRGDDVLAGPLTYSLWCDYFEDGATVKHAWHELVGEGNDWPWLNKTSRTAENRNLLRYVLKVSGPVLFRLKEELYSRLIADKTWHEYIFLSLLYSQYDVYGKINKEKALAILNQLDLPVDTKHLAMLRLELAQGE